MKKHYHELNKIEKFINSPWFIVVILSASAIFVFFCSFAKPWNWQIWIDLGIK
jgi:hypothetical protein